MTSHSPSNLTSQQPREAAKVYYLNRAIASNHWKHGIQLLNTAKVGRFGRTASKSLGKKNPQKNAEPKIRIKENKIKRQKKSQETSCKSWANPQVFMCESTWTWSYECSSQQNLVHLHASNDGLKNDSPSGWSSSCWGLHCTTRKIYILNLEIT